MSYQILKADHPEDLAGLVNSAMAAGWQPVGGVAMATNPYHMFIWAQAMIRAY